MKGILFRPEMHQAIRSGNKTVTRRLLNPQPSKYTTGMRQVGHQYHPGETVYVKEAWRYYGGKEYEYQRVPKAVIYRCDGEVERQYWHAPLFMPAWAARTFLLIKDVRPERLQSIREEDAITEGIDFYSRTVRVKPKELYADLWDSINKAPGTRWADNPWVWRIEFEVKP